MKNFKQLLFTALLIVIGMGNTFAQSKPTLADTIKKMADTKHLTFVAQKADVSTGAGSETGLARNSTATGTNHVPLSDGFTLAIKPDSIVSFLPYFSINTDNQNEVATNNYDHITVNIVGTHFATATYKYLVKQKKKGDVEIKINPAGDSPIEQYMLEITPTGTAELTLNIRDHAAIVYNGIIQF